MSTTIENKETEFGNITIERPEEGQPYKGKVLAAVQPHADDIPLFCGGTIAKFIAEGYPATSSRQPTMRSADRHQV